MPEEQDCLQKVEGEGGADMSEKGQPLPYRLGACAGCRDLTEQLARSTHAYQLLAEAHEQQGQQLQQLGAITLALNDVGCPLDESGSDFILRQAQQLASLRRERTDDQLHTDNIELRQRVADLQAQWHYAATCDAEMDHVAETFRLKQQLAQKQQECDEHVENLSRCKGNELAEQLAQAQAEIEDWRSKFQRALTR
jgi:hypothetical protein